MALIHEHDARRLSELKQLAHVDNVVLQALQAVQRDVNTRVETALKHYEHAVRVHQIETARQQHERQWARSELWHMQAREHHQRFAGHP